MSSWQSGDVEVDGLRLHYTRTGGAKPPLLLAHGFADDGLCWTPIAQALEPEYDLIMVDARGHGRSAGPEQGNGHAEQAGDLAGAIAALGLRRPALLGHSMGAATALVLAGTRPDLLSAILLEDPPVFWMGDQTLPLAAQRWEQRMRPLVVALKRKTRAELIGDQRAAEPGWSEAELGPWADAKLRLSFNTLNRVSAAPLDWPRTLRSISCPALLITADAARGAIITPASAAALQALVPQLTIAHIPQAGHNIRRDQPARYLDVVRAFLAEHAGSR